MTNLVGAKPQKEPSHAEKMDILIEKMGGLKKVSNLLPERMPLLIRQSLTYWDNLAGRISWTRNKYGHRAPILSWVGKHEVWRKISPTSLSIRVCVLKRAYRRNKDNQTAIATKPEEKW